MVRALKIFKNKLPCNEPVWTFDEDYVHYHYLAQNDSYIQLLAKLYACFLLLISYMINVIRSSFVRYKRFIKPAVGHEVVIAIGVALIKLDCVCKES